MNNIFHHVVLKAMARIPIAIVTYLKEQISSCDTES